MLTGTVWPAHPHPLPGECLSSWLIRCAHANGMKVQTFCVRVFGSERQIWNRDIDRYAPEWLLKLMSEKTGIPFYMVTKATIRLFEGRLFEKRFISGQLRWILPLALYHRTFRNFGVQYCPQCLAEDTEPYFRLAWRLALYTFCPRHQILLHDRCYNCQMPVSYHRTELGKPNQIEGEPLDHCWHCGAKLSEAPQVSVYRWHKTVFTQWEALLKAVDRQFVNCGPLNYSRLVLLHQICRLIVSVNLAPKLQSYLCLVSGQPYRKLYRSKKPFEHRALGERHYVLGLSSWLCDTRSPRKLRTVIFKKCLPRNQIFRDLSAFEIAMINDFLGYNVTCNKRFVGLGSVVNHSTN